MDVIQIQSMVSGRDRKPYVVLIWEDKRWQLPVDEARQHALRILSCADGAESDAFIVEFFSSKGRFSDGEVAAILHHFREYRQELAKGGVTQ